MMIERVSTGRGIKNFKYELESLEKNNILYNILREPIDNIEKWTIVYYLDVNNYNE